MVLAICTWNGVIHWGMGKLPDPTHPQEKWLFLPLQPIVVLLGVSLGRPSNELTEAVVGNIHKNCTRSSQLMREEGKCLNHKLKISGFYTN